MEENKIQVLIKIDSRNLVTSINSNIFIDNLTDWIKIDEGVGDKYAHAQGNYLPNSLIDEKGRYNYKVVDGNIAALTEEEKEVLFPTSEPEPTDDEIQNDFNLDMDYRVSCLELGIV